MKPIVHYQGEAKPVGGRAYLTPIDHHHGEAWQCITNGRPATTSRVLHWDKKTGRIETQNTVYEPAEMEAA